MKDGVGREGKGDGVREKDREGSVAWCCRHSKSVSC